MKNENWDANQIHDQKGKVVVVTGSTSGIGFEAARVFASKNAEVILAVRNINKGKNAAERIISQTQNSQVSVMELDLSSLKSVKNFAEKFNEKFTRLDLLINNAGVMIPPYSKTEDGFELQFGTNHLGHFALTAHLLEIIEKTENSRIINVASSAHKMGNINFDDLNWEKRKYKSWNAYGDSKIANLYFTYELQNRLKKKGSKVLVTAAHPGWTATDLQRHNSFFEFMNKFFAQNIEMGTLPTLRAAVEENIEGAEYYGPNGWQEWKGYPIKVKSNSLSYDKNIAKKLWEVSESLTNVKFNLN